MEKDIKSILKIIEDKDEYTQMMLICECAKKIGTKEWQKEIIDLMKRMEALKRVK